MKKNNNFPIIRFYLILLFGIVAVFLITVWFFPSNVDFRPQNPFWNGLEEFQRELSAIELDSLDVLSQIDETDSAILIIPHLPFSDSELTDIYFNIIAEGMGM